MDPHTKEYIDYLQSEAWNQKRLERLQLDGYICQDCGAVDKALDVHHTSYDNFRNEPMCDLISLCRRCHNYRHGKIQIAFFNCPTCLEFLPISIQKIRIMKHDIMKLVCADGHVRTYNDESDTARYYRKIW
jgi:hypothetical protein